MDDFNDLVYLAPILPGFLARHPKVDLVLDATDREVNLIEERVEVLPDWTATTHRIYLLYPSPRGMLPSVRSLIDYLVAHMPASIRERSVEVEATHRIGPGVWSDRPAAEEPG